jgi:hypothetical protein
VIAVAVALLAGLLDVAAAPSGFKKIAPGVERLHLDEGDSELLRFDLQRFRLEVVVPGAADPVTAARARLEARAALAINGGFFDTEGRPLGLRIAGGKVVQGLRPRVDWGVLVVRAGQASIVHSRAYAPDPTVTAALQVGPRILVGGQVPGLKPQAARRTAVALDRSGRFVTIVVTRTRVQASALGAMLAQLGFDSALMFDGGPSTQLSAAIGGVGIEIEGGYAVPDALLVLPR